MQTEPTTEEQIKTLEARVRELERENEELRNIRALYEENGLAKMYYALQRKMNEIGNLFNEKSLEDVKMDDPKDKTFDRIFKLIEKSEVVANAAKVLKEFGGITGNEAADVARKPFADRLAQDREV